MNVAMKNEIAFQAAQRCTGRTMRRILCKLLFLSQQKHWRYLRLDNERLCWPHASTIDGFATEFPTHRMRMKVVPVHACVEVEDEPADTLTTAADNGRRVADKSSAVNAVGLHRCALLGSNSVMRAGVIDPGDRAAKVDCYLCGRKGHGRTGHERDRHRIGSSRHDMNDAFHFGMVTAEVFKIACGVEGQLRFATKLFNIVGVECRP